MRKTLIAMVVAVLSLGLVVGPVWAGTCPKKIQEVKDAMAKGKYDKAKTDKATALLGEAQKLHEAGQHDQALKKVQEARDALGLPKATS
ncbi:MAG: hypothetical protein ACREJP_07865 [Candidatus Methylomirabilales bacterium]